MFKKNSFNSFPNNAKLQGKHLIDVSVLTTAVSTFANRAFCRIESLNTIQAQRRAAVLEGPDLWNRGTQCRR